MGYRIGMMPPTPTKMSLSIGVLCAVSVSLCAALSVPARAAPSAAVASFADPARRTKLAAAFPEYAEYVAGLAQRPDV